jgi:hypothetical protein
MGGIVHEGAEGRVQRLGLTKSGTKQVLLERLSGFVPAATTKGSSPDPDDPDPDPGPKNE